VVQLVSTQVTDSVVHTPVHPSTRRCIQSSPPTPRGATPLQVAFFTDLSFGGWRLTATDAAITFI
jgi:hypothetical protein